MTDLPTIPQYTLLTELTALDRKIAAWQGEKAGAIVHIRLNERLKTLLKDDETYDAEISGGKKMLKRAEVSLMELEAMRAEVVEQIKQQEKTLEPAPNGKRGKPIGERQ